MVKFFVKYEVASAKELKFLAIAHPISVLNYNPKIHITRVTFSSLVEIVVFNVEDICTVCTFL